MLQCLHHKRTPISRWLLILLGIVWLGLAVQTCAMAEAQAGDGTVDCCCEENGSGCDKEYTPFAEAPCPTMQAATSDRRSQGLPGDQRTPVHPIPAVSRIVYPPISPGFAAVRLAGFDAHDSHPALRFRVLLI